jgi:chromate transporter
LVLKSPEPTAADRVSASAILEILLAFLALGVTAFGGPIAHIGYFRRAFVERRGWVSERAFADLVALAQFLPGPASSQVGFSIGLLRGGLLAGIAAWVGFTLPSAVLLLGFALMQAQVSASPFGLRVNHGLQLVAVAVVGHAVMGMRRTLCPDLPRVAIAVGAGLGVLVLPSALSQIAVMAGGALAGWILCRQEPETRPAAEDEPGGSVSRSLGPLCIGLFALLFLPGSAWFRGSDAAALFHGFYRTGALVFGGGHVVLPLLREQVVGPGWVTEAQFLSGYGAAQAVPGPLFTLAAYLGADSKIGGGGLGGGAIALAGIFLPGLLLMTAALPHWARLKQSAPARAVMRGTNAAVVGVLAVAFYNPLCTGAIHGLPDLGLAAAGFLALSVLEAPPLLVLAMIVAASTALPLT